MPPKKTTQKASEPAEGDAYDWWVEAIAVDLLQWNMTSLPFEGETLANTFVILERLIRLATDILFNLEVNSMPVFHIVFAKESPHLDVRQYLQWRFSMSLRTAICLPATARVQR